MDPKMVMAKVYGRNCYLIVAEGKDRPYHPAMGVCKTIPLNESDIVLDIGAFVGTYSVIAAEHAKKITAFEPSEKQYAVLEKNSDLYPRITPFCAAVVGDNAKFIEFYPGGSGTSDSRIPSRFRNTGIQVPALNYHKVAQTATVVKVDIEGGEYFIDGLWTPLTSGLQSSSFTIRDLIGRKRP